MIEMITGLSLDRGVRIAVPVDSLMLDVVEYWYDDVALVQLTSGDGIALSIAIHDGSLIDLRPLSELDIDIDLAAVLLDRCRRGLPR